MTKRSPNILWPAVLLATFALGGCDPSRAELPSPPMPNGTPAPDVPGGSATIHGRVTWPAAVPVVDALHVRGNPLAPTTFSRRRDWPNPNAPQIDRGTRGIANAVVFLREAPSPSRQPWPHPPVRVEIRDSQFRVLQGQTPTTIGIVRRGEEVEFVSHDASFHSVHARGAAFFSLALPDAGLPARRPLREGGIVELSSGAGRYWMRAYLLVTDHPFCTLTDAEGRFLLEGVPTGEFEVVCWLPNWRVARQERDPESV